MRVNISNINTNLAGAGNLVIGPGGVPPILEDINTKLILERFSASKTTLLPFEDFEADWLVTAASTNVNIANYHFRIKSHYDILADNIGSQGQATISIYKRTLLTLQARKGGARWSNLGESITMLIDDSNCEEKDIPGALIDDALTTQTTAALTGIPALRFRSGRTVESTWHNQYIEYKMPLEIVLNNFFNGDFDITWKVFFSVDYDNNTDCFLDVSISSSENANFHWLEDVLSLGHSATIAETIERLMPTIMQPIISRAEGAMVNAICAILGFNNYFDTHKMLSVNIIPDNSFRFLEFMFCEKDV